MTARPAPGDHMSVIDVNPPRSGPSYARQHDCAGRGMRHGEGSGAMMETIDEHRDALYRFAFAMLRNRADAEDAVQDTCLRIVSGRNAEGDGIDNPRAWAFRVLRNVCIDRLRQRNRGLRARLDPQFGSQVHALEGSAVDAETSFIAVDTLCRVTAAMDDLPPDEAQTLSLVVAEGLSYAETAYVTGVPVGTVRSRLHRARKLLRARLDTPQGDPRVVPLSRRRAFNRKAT